MKHIILYLSFTISLFTINAQNISEHFFGQNAWMPSWYFNGKLDKIWQEAEPANFEIIRIGGIEYEDNFDAHIDDYIRFIDSIRIVCNAEPLLQVPRTYTTQQTNDLYDYINVTHNRNVKLWSIGNEPDTHNPNTSTEIKDFFISIAKALKDKDENLIIIGPDYANYWVWVGDQYDAGQTTYSNFINDVGLEMNTAQTAYLLDVFAFHNYIGYTVDAVIDGQDLERVIDKVKTTLTTVNNQRTLGLKNKANWAIGEFNISNDGSDKRQRWSFYAGQYFAMVYGVGMKKEADFICPWSLIEGEYLMDTDLSMFENEANSFKPRSTFYHVKMLTDNRRSNYMTSTSSNNLVKTVGMKDSNGSVLMVLNTSESNSFMTTIKLDNGTTSVNQLIINADAGLNISYTEEIPANTTITFVFNNNGEFVKKYTYDKLNAENCEEPIVTYANPPLSILNKKMSSSIFPNPVQNELSIQTEGSTDVIITNFNGEIVLKQTNVTNKTKLDLSKISNGIYFITLLEDDNVSTLKLIKN